MHADHVTLRDGAHVLIRPIGPSDRDELAAGFERLSPESRYRRFFGPMKELSARELDRLTQIDHSDHEALVAFDESTGEGIGVARYVRTDLHEAEPAVVIADAWQRRGLATELLDRLAERAREEGIERFRAPVLAQNRGAIALLHRLGEAETTRTGREVEIRIELDRPEAARQDLLALLRSVAAGTLAPGRNLLRRALPHTAGPPDRSALRDVMVVATDGSPPARAAVRCAAGLAPALGLAVHLVAVHWPLLGGRDAMDAALDSAAAELRGAGAEVTAHVRRGDPAASVIDVAAEERARLILLGPQGATTASSLLLGSVSRTVAAHAPCDVLIVRERP